MSIRKNIERYNNDFYLNFTGTQYLENSSNYIEITDSNDWSISCFDIISSISAVGSGVQHTLFSSIPTASVRGINIRTTINEVLINFRDSSNTYASVFRVKNLYTTTNTPKVTSYVINYDSINREIKCFSNGVEMDLITGSAFVPVGLNFTQNSNLSRIGAYANNAFFRNNGGVRDFATFNKVLTEQEINYIYYNGILPISTYTNIKHYYPLNHIPYESGGNYYFKDVAKLYNNTIVGDDLEAIGWTGLALGVPLNTTASTYKDMKTKSTIIPPVGYNKGLNFLRANQQWLEITGLEVFDKSEGYTILVGSQVPLGNSNQFYICGFGGDQGPAQTFRFFKSTGFSRYAIGYPSGGTGILRNPAAGYSYNVQNMHLASMVCTPNTDVVNPYNNTAQKTNAMIGVNGSHGHLSLTDVPVFYGFDEFTNPLFRIGRGYGVAQYYGGKISYFVVYKGLLTQEEIKKISNNGLFRNPYDIVPDPNKIILDIDFQNPFDNGTDIEFPDNSGNCTVIANQNSGTDWDTLIGVQNSID